MVVGCGGLKEVGSRRWVLGEVEWKEGEKEERLTSSLYFFHFYMVACFAWDYYTLADGDDVNSVGRFCMRVIMWKRGERGRECSGCTYASVGSSGPG